MSSSMPMGVSQNCKSEVLQQLQFEGTYTDNEMSNSVPLTFMVSSCQCLFSFSLVQHVLDSYEKDLKIHLQNEVAELCNSWYFINFQESDMWCIQDV